MSPEIYSVFSESYSFGAPLYSTLVHRFSLCKARGGVVIMYRVIDANARNATIGLPRISISFSPTHTVTVLLLAVTAEFQWQKRHRDSPPSNCRPPLSWISPGKKKPMYILSFAIMTTGKSQGNPTSDNCSNWCNRQHGELETVVVACILRNC